MRNVIWGICSLIALGLPLGGCCFEWCGYDLDDDDVAGNDDDDAGSDDDDAGSDDDDAGDGTFPCGDSLSCEIGTTYCLEEVPGVPGPSTLSCVDIPAACQPDPDCTCVLAGEPWDCTESPEDALKVTIYYP